MRWGGRGSLEKRQLRTELFGGRRPERNREFSPAVKNPRKEKRPGAGDSEGRGRFLIIWKGGKRAEGGLHPLKKKFPKE